MSSSDSTGDNRDKVQVCVVGLGIAGLSVAYLAAKAGRTVVVLGDSEIGGGETGRTTAHLTNAFDDRYFELERLHGIEGARIVADSHSAAIDFIERVVREENIECGFERVDGYLMAPRDLAERDELLERELEASRRAGVSAEIVATAPTMPQSLGPFLHFSQQAQLEPVQYVRGLASAVLRDGGTIFPHTHVASIKGGRNAHVTTAQGVTIHADHIVVATNTPVNDLVAIHTKQTAYRTYVVALRVRRGSVARALWWDGFWVDETPYHYVRVHSVGEDDVLIVGGEDHKTGQADDGNLRYGWLESWARAHFPCAEEVVARWSGQVLDPDDGVAFIGRNPLDHNNVYVITGDSGNGMTHGVLAGVLINDLIAGRENAWSKLYEPSRITLRAVRNYARHAMNMTAQYADWATGSEVNSIDEIPPESGAVIRRGLKKIAVYRDADGTITEFSAMCPHLAGVVHWNPAEKTWDCPCHGSRFDCQGHVLNGPAISNLTVLGTAVEQPLVASRD